MMTKESLAAAIHGCEYRQELSRFDGREAKAAGLVVVYGASDDLMDLEGAISDETGAPGLAYVDALGLLNRDSIEDGDDEEIAAFVARKKSARTIRAVCGPSDLSWSYETDIPHATFDVLEDGDVYCRGIVFALADL
jgi:hypothetical protein